MREWQGGKEFDDHGARYLLLRFSASPSAHLDLDGFVPETSHRGETQPERHGRDVPRAVSLLETGHVDYETEIVVDDRNASHYRLAVATGEWTTATIVPLDLSSFRGFPDSGTPSGKVTLAQGSWGRLTEDASDYDRLRGKQGYSGPGPELSFAVEEPEPRRLATRLRFLDASGRSELTGEIRPWNDFRPNRIEVETRPYSWVEFSNVHYDPDPAKWLKAYWGVEGNVANVKAGGVTLRAIVAPTIEGGKLYPTHVYAPDGRLWRAFPDAAGVSWGWILEKDMSHKLLANFQTDSAQAANDTMVKAFASNGNVPGQDLGQALMESPWAIRVAPVPFLRPTTPYVQFRVDRPLMWEKAGEIAPPSPKQIDLLARKGGEPASSRPSLWISVAAVGHADVLGVDGAVSTRVKAVVWPVREPGTWARLVVRTRDGVRHRAQGFAIPDRLGTSHTEALFTPDGQGDVIWQTSEGSPTKKVAISLRDVAAFEIETQDFAPPVYLVAKVPPVVP